MRERAAAAARRTSASPWPCARRVRTSPARLARIAETVIATSESDLSTATTRSVFPAATGSRSSGKVEAARAWRARRRRITSLQRRAAGPAVFRALTRECMPEV